MSGFLGGIGQVAGNLGRVTQAAAGIAGLARGVGALLGGGFGPYGAGINPAAGAWLAQLQPASWRGLPFAVRESEIQRGRRTAVHEYPYRDQVWVEDLGRAMRRVAFSGFVLGDDCYQQEQALLAASEQPGSGVLVHPSLGMLTVSLLERMHSRQRADLGRVVEVTFDCVESGLSVYPDGSASTADAVDEDADDADDAAGSDFAADALGSVVYGASVVRAGARTAQGFVQQVQQLAGDARLVTSAVAGLVPPAGTTYGRYAGGARGTVLPGLTTVPQALAAATAARTAVGLAVSNVVARANAL